MKVLWTQQALEVFQSIQSRHFSLIETQEYKKDLVTKIQDRVSLIKTSIPSNQSGWEGTYKVIVDQYIVYYSLSDDHTA
ncbi:hypothetical protein NSQ43_15550 [Sporosarcina sp. FSL W8-0480]|uniref:hypothetical protein n=1 Tax=Sporosarcina sp. FSL W8-0480 TaxID=2954701 RepID=UPI0030D73E16